MLQKEDYILLKFSLESPIYFKLGSYVECEFGLFEACDLQSPTFNTNTAGYDYELRLDAHYWKWKNKIFKYTPETAGQEASWNLTAPLDVQAGIVLRNLKALGYTYKGKDFVFSIDSTVENKAQVMSYNSIDILNACLEIAKKWDCECWITENIIHFGRCEFGDAVDFEIAKNVDSMPRSDSQSDYATRIYAFGSTRNIPVNYRPVDETVVVNGVVQRRLMLPADTPYIDAYPNMRLEEAVEQVITFDEIYPRRIGTMSDVTTKEYTEAIENTDGTTTENKWDAYRFKDTGINFSKDYVLPGEELKITFHSGKLNGMTFAVTFNPENESEKSEDDALNPDAQVWEIVRNEDYGRKLPGDVLIPANGDTYVLSGWDSTKIAELGLVDAAEQELKEEAEKYIAKSKVDPNTYTCKMMSDSVYSEDGVYDFYGAGQRVNLINKAYFENGRQSRIIGFEFNLDYPFDSPIYTVGETAAYSRIGELENKVENLTFKGQTYTGIGGSGIYLITSNDTTPATDSNAFSARRALKMFLRKDKADIAQEMITYLKGLLIGKNGSGITSLENGTSQAVVDYLYVKVKAVFDELDVKKKNYVGGEQVISHAGMRCIKVEELTDAYRCYLKAEEDGIEIENQFTVGSLAIAQECNIKTGVSHHVGNRYFWRLVTTVGFDYIDLSKTICDSNVENDIPAAGDNIVGLGHKTDITRQAAIILSSTNETSPSIIMYQGIDDFTLANKEVISFEFDKVTGRANVRIYGDTYIGDKDRNQYIEYKDGKVNINAIVHMGPGSTGFENFSDVEFGKINLIRNSGFAGDYNSAKLEDGSEVTDETELYNQAIKWWAATNVTINYEDNGSATNRSATLATGVIMQTLYYRLMEGERYILSFKAKGSSVTINVGGLEQTQELKPQYDRYVFHFTAVPDTEIAFSGSCTITEIQLERGTVLSVWSLSPLDNNSFEAKFEALKYLTDSIREGSSTFIGGLGLLSMILVGNYIDGELKKVTGGFSGVYNDDDDPLLWGSGDLEKAVRTISKCKDDPMAFLNMSDAELSGYVKTVLTHGGRTVLSDAIVRGYLYAIDGYFKGTVDMGDGVTHFGKDGTGWIGKVGDEYFAKWDKVMNGTFCGGNIKWDNVKKVLDIAGKFNAKGGSKMGNLTIADNGAMFGGNAVFEDVGYTWLPVVGGSQDSIAAQVRKTIINQIGRSTTILLNMNVGQNNYTYTVDLPTRDELNSRGVSSDYGFRMTLLVTGSYFMPGWGQLDLNPRFRITSRPKKTVVANFQEQEWPDGEIHDNNDTRMEYIEMAKGDVLELYYYGGVYYLLNNRT